MHLGSLRRRARAIAFALGGLLLAFAPAAQAAWFRAETDRFIVYGEGSASRVQTYATKLMAFDRVLHVFHPSLPDNPPATKLTVYLVNSRDDLRRVQPDAPRGLGGFYTASPEAIFAIGLDAQATGDDVVMFHEYAHHFMLENFPAAYPAWFVEGFAEYFGPTEIKPGGIIIGGFSKARAYGIYMQRWLPLEDVLSKSVAETDVDRRNVYYSEAWLLTHYMRSDDTRREQLNQAARAIAGGAPPVKAMEDATGMTMAQLTRALHDYQRLSRIGMKYPFTTPPPMTVTKLPPSADDLLLDQLRLVHLGTSRPDPAFLAAVRKRAAKYAGDDLAEMTLARAEFTMGDVEAGRAIVARRLAAKPDDKETLLLAGRGEMMAGVRDPAVRVERFRVARGYFAKVYAADKADYRPLYFYAASRSIESAYPTDNDLKALLEARALAPSVREISLRAGLALLKKGDRKRAEVVLAPVINNPHGGRAAAQAKALLQGARMAESDLDKDEGGDAEAPPGEPEPPPTQPPPAKPAAK